MSFFFGGTTASWQAFATRNLTTVFFGIRIWSPVRGLRPLRAFPFRLHEFSDSGNDELARSLRFLYREIGNRLEPCSGLLLRNLHRFRHLSHDLGFGHGFFSPFLKSPFSLQLTRRIRWLSFERYSNGAILMALHEVDKPERYRCPKEQTATLELRHGPDSYGCGDGDDQQCQGLARACSSPRILASIGEPSVDTSNTKRPGA